MSSFAGLRLAVGLLTIVPVRPPEEIGRPQARAAMLLAPLAVLPPALVVVGLGWGALQLGLPAAIAGVLVVAGLAFGTRAMHLDGLADTTDGLGSGKPADAALEIMKRGDIGPMGTASLVLVLLAQSLAVGAIVERPYGWLEVVVAVCGARAALVLGCVKRVLAARPEGLGSMVAGSVPTAAAAAGWVLAGVAAVGAGLLAGRPWWLPLAAAVAAVAASGWLLARCVRRLGGMNGDVLGAMVELAATVWLVMTAVQVS